VIDLFLVLHIWGRLENSILTSAAMPFQIGSKFLIVLYWQLTLSRANISVNLPTTTKFKWLFCSMIVFLFFVEIFTSTFRALSMFGKLGSVVPSVVYVICLLSLTVWYLMTAVKVLRIVRSTNNKRVARLNRLIVFSAMGSIVWVIGVAFLAVDITNNIVYMIG
jgi:hypothetical protein